MTETTGTSLRGFECVYFLPGRLTMRGNHHLTDSFSVFDLHFLLRQIDQNNPYFAPVVGINSAGSVQYGESFFEGQTAAGLI